MTTEPPVQMNNRCKRMPPNSSKNILPCSFAVSIREFAQKKYKDGIAEIKSAKELKFMTLKRESTPQHSANSESARHPFSSVGYIVEYENSGTPCIQLAVTKEGSPTNNNK